MCLAAVAQWSISSSISSSNTTVAGTEAAVEAAVGVDVAEEGDAAVAVGVVAAEAVAAVAEVAVVAEAAMRHSNNISRSNHSNTTTSRARLKTTDPRATSCRAATAVEAINRRRHSSSRASRLDQASHRPTRRINTSSYTSTNSQCTTNSSSRHISHLSNRSTRRHRADTHQTASRTRCSRASTSQRHNTSRHHHSHIRSSQWHRSFTSQHRLQRRHCRASRIRPSRRQALGLCRHCRNSQRRRCRPRSRCTVQLRRRRRCYHRASQWRMHQCSSHHSHNRATATHSTRDSRRMRQ